VPVLSFWRLIFSIWLLQDKFLGKQLLDLEKLEIQGNMHFRISQPITSLHTFIHSYSLSVSLSLPPSPPPLSSFLYTGCSDPVDQVGLELTDCLCQSSAWDSYMPPYLYSLSPNFLFPIKLSSSKALTSRLLCAWEFLKELAKTIKP